MQRTTRSLALASFVLIGAQLALSQSPQKAQKTPPPPAKSDPQPDPLAALLRQAADALTKNDYAAALAPLQNYLAQRPNDADIHFQLGYALSNLNRTPEAKTEYQKAIELNPKLTAAYVNLGILLLDQDPAQAIEPLRQAAELMPDRARTRYLLAQAYERSKNLDAALASYLEAAKLDPKDFEVQFALGRVMLQTNHAAEAEARFREALAIKPEAARAQLGLAESLMVQKKYEAAANAFATYLAATPEDRESRREEVSVLVQLEKYEQALAELDRADAGAAPSLASAMLRAKILMAQKQWPQARDALQVSTQQFPDNATLHARLGRILLAMRDFPAAEKELRRALTLDLQMTDALRDLTTVYYLAKDCPSALAALDLLDKREPPTPGSMFVRATCYDTLGKKPEAIAAYQKFLELDQGKNDTQDWQARQRILTLTHELQKKR